MQHEQGSLRGSLWSMRDCVEQHSWSMPSVVQHHRYDTRMSQLDPSAGEQTAQDEDYAFQALGTKKRVGQLHCSSLLPHVDLLVLKITRALCRYASQACIGIFMPSEHALAMRAT